MSVRDDYVAVLREPALPPCLRQTATAMASTMKDCHDTEHSVEVYAESLYEAALRGLSRLEDVGWESNASETIQRVEVEIHQEPARHIVDVPKLLKWIQEDSGYPAQKTRKEKLRKLLSTQQDEGRLFSLYLARS